jgi:hypothetical protein
MQNSINIPKPYYELSEHNSRQILIFTIITICWIFVFLELLLPLMQYFFASFLKGVVYNKTGEVLQYSVENSDIKGLTSYFFSWAIDLNKGTPLVSRYWFNPFLTLILQSSLFAVGFAVLLTSIMPRSIGYMHQKIEREIISLIDKISFIKFGYHSDNRHSEVIDDILHSDIRQLQTYVDELKMPLDDLKVLHKAIKWNSSGLLYRIIHVNDGIKMYMRFYFTVRYNNTILGLVYIGAAVLIIIIGLRGLKFIPPTEPSLVLFALGLEFTLLIIYAIVMMYSREEDEFSPEQAASRNDTIMLGKDFGSSREIENLLRVFINKKAPGSKTGNN